MGNAKISGATSTFDYIYLMPLIGQKYPFEHHRKLPFSFSNSKTFILEHLNHLLAIIMVSEWKDRL